VLQVNLADQDAVSESDGGFRYEIEASTNRRAWHTIAPAAATGRDAQHSYHVLARPEQARFVRIRNLHTPNDAKFSLFGLRAFGTAAVRRSRRLGTTRPGRSSTRPAGIQGAGERRFLRRPARHAR
jgi:hypothetical protein